MDRPDIYTDGVRPERCANCGHARTTVFRSVYGTERIEYECMRRPEFIHRTQGEVHVVDIPDSEVEEMDNPLEEIKDDAHWFIETYGREAWCEEVTRLGRQL